MHLKTSSVDLKTSGMHLITSRVDLKTLLNAFRAFLNHFSFHFWTKRRYFGHSKYFGQKGANFGQKDN